MKPRSKLGRRLREHREAKGLSAYALSLQAGLGPNYVHYLERVGKRPDPSKLAAICRALELGDRDIAELRRLAGIEADSLLHLAGIEESLAARALWRYLPGLLFEVRHDELVLFDHAADDVVADLPRALGALLGWLALLNEPPRKTQTARLRRTAEAAFDTSMKLPSRIPTLGPATPARAAGDAASALPRAWRDDLFAKRATASRVSNWLRYWSYRPCQHDQPALIGARLKDDQLDQLYSFGSASVEWSMNVHDALIAVRLWELLDLAALFGVQMPPVRSAQEHDLVNALAAPAGDIYTLLHTPADQVALDAEPPPAEVAAWRRWRDAQTDYRMAAEHVDLALRLYELPSLAARVLRTFRPAQTDAPVPRDELERALARAADLAGGISPRFPGTETAQLNPPPAAATMNPEPE